MVQLHQRAESFRCHGIKHAPVLRCQSADDVVPDRRIRGSGRRRRRTLSSFSRKTSYRSSSEPTSGYPFPPLLPGKSTTGVLSPRWQVSTLKALSGRRVLFVFGGALGSFRSRAQSFHCVQLVQLATIKQVTPPSEEDSPAQTPPAGWLQQWS